MKRVMLGSDHELKLNDEVQEMHEIEGEQSNEDIEEKFLHSLSQEDEQNYDDASLMAESFNQGIGAFNPDIMFENMVNNYSMAKKVYGETLIRLISGYNSSYVEKNIKIPEFKRELKKRIAENAERLKDEKLLKRDYSVSEQGLKLASLLMYTEELDNIVPKGIFGEKVHKKDAHYGERGDTRSYRKGDRYKDIEIKESLKMAIRRGHGKIMEKDLRTSERQSKGKVEIIYALDASGSMKGKKIEMSKKAGIALAYKAIEAKDGVGLIVFGSEIKEEIRPTEDFSLLLKEITRIKASKQTDFKGMLQRSLGLFDRGDYTKHLIMLTDAMPTVGNNPEKETLREVSNLMNAGVTVSLIGINLDEEASKLAEKIVEVGNGRLYSVRAVNELDKIVLEDYYSVA